MTRKRYTKLLMALGVSRNRANAMAYACRVAGLTYATDYNSRLPWLMLTNAADGVSKAMRKLGKTMATALGTMAQRADLLVAALAESFGAGPLGGGGHD